MKENIPNYRPVNVKNTRLGKNTRSVMSMVHVRENRQLIGHTPCRQKTSSMFADGPVNHMCDAVSARAHGGSRMANSRTKKGGLVKPKDGLATRNEL